MGSDPKRPAHYGGPGNVVDPRTYGKMHGLDFDEISAIKYITRWRRKGGLPDIDKAIHYLQLIRAEAVEAEIAAKATNPQNALSMAALETRHR